MEDRQTYYSPSIMWDNYQQIKINRDHAIVVPKRCRPGLWFGPGSAFLAPLHRKRGLLIPRSNWVHAWTLYNDELGTEGWLVTAQANPTLHFPIEINARSPTGWYLTIPQELRQKGWLPERAGIVMFEYSETEANIWTEAAYNEECILEADAE